MKKQIISILIVFAILLISCAKEEEKDTISPVISLNGKYEDTLSLNASYTDPGATAQDNANGDISSSIIKTGTVNADLAGEYNLYYDVSDKEGNKAVTAKRIVKVVNDAEYLVGVYTAVPSCGATPTSQYDATITSSSTVNNRFFFSTIVGGAGNSIAADVNGNNITIPQQTISNSVYAGTGTVTGNNFSISTTVTYPGTGAYNCTIPHTRK